MCIRDRPYTGINFKELFILAVATSIDALAVGVTFAFLQVDIVPEMCIRDRPLTKRRKVGTTSNHHAPYILGYTDVYKRQVYAFTLIARFPSVLNEPLSASVTFWEATAPVKQIGRAHV